MSAYVIEHKTTETSLHYLPKSFVTKNGHNVKLDRFQVADKMALYEIFKEIVETGQTYPQEKLERMEDFEAYFLSHDAFTVRSESGEPIAGFYVKPNFPGRSSHVCNAGFVVQKEWRNEGIGAFMTKLYLRIARDLGYKGSFFNLVYVTNENAISVYERFGFKVTGVVPKAGRLKDLGYVDAKQLYFDLENWPIPEM